MPQNYPTTLLLFSLLLGGTACKTQLAQPVVALPACSDLPLGPFARSAGGVPEVQAEWLLHPPCAVRVVDVREEEEIRGSPRSVPGATFVPLQELEAVAASWSAAEPVILVDRSGRRSARGVEALERLGFTRAASLTGGLLNWEARNYPSSVLHLPLHPAHETRPETGMNDLGLPTRPDEMRWAKAASLLLQGAVSCVDGRDTLSVIGTPGGDAGELLLALASLESTSGRPIPTERIPSIVSAWIGAFGQVYVHTDRHAVERLEHDLHGDPAFAAWFQRHAPIEQLLRHPPRELEEALAARMLQPEHIGCGHLRLVLQNGEAYGVRPELSRAVLESLLHTLWRHPEQIHFAILEGSHQETAVVTVSLGHSLAAHDDIPAVTPHAGPRQVFVYHPEAAEFLRSEETSFFISRSEWLLGEPVDEAAYRARLTELGNQQLAQTLSTLAPKLPHYTLRFQPSPPPNVRPQTAVLEGPN